MRIHPMLMVAALLALAATTSRARAAGTVQLELVGNARGGAAMAFQEWGRALGKAGIRNVRIRSGARGARVGIETRGTPQNPVYVVTGVIKSRDELLLPAGRFRRSDVGRISTWLKDLAQHGPGGKKVEPKSAFGLASKQFEQLQQAMSVPLNSSTRGTSRRRVVDTILARLTSPPELSRQMAEAIGEDPVEEELKGLSCGTALACALRPSGLCLVPRMQGGRPTLVVAKARPSLDVWPVGWAPRKPLRELVPAMHEFHNVNVQGVTAAVALEAIGKRLKTPVLLDHNALARHGIDPTKAVVSHPRSRTTYSIALKKLLFRAGLRYEVRVDESGKPFLWVGTMKPV